MQLADLLFEGQHINPFICTVNPYLSIYLSACRPLTTSTVGFDCILSLPVLSGIGGALLSDVPVFLPQEQCKKLRDEREGAMKDLAVLRCDLDAGRAERERLLAELKEARDELEK